MLTPEVREELNILWNWVGLVKASNWHAVQESVFQEDRRKAAVVTLEGYLKVLQIFRYSRYDLLSSTRHPIQ